MSQAYRCVSRMMRITSQSRHLYTDSHNSSHNSSRQTHKPSFSILFVFPLPSSPISPLKSYQFSHTLLTIHRTNPLHAPFPPSFSAEKLDCQTPTNARRTKVKLPPRYGIGLDWNQNSPSSSPSISMSSPSPSPSPVSMNTRRVPSPAVCQTWLVGAGWVSWLVVRWRGRKEGEEREGRKWDKEERRGREK